MAVRRNPADAGFFSRTELNDRASNITAGQASQDAAGEDGIAFDDAALVERTCNGDMRAFGVLVAKYQDRILNMILRMCPRHAEAEELTQETFLKALERIGQFRGHSKFYTWLFRIGANLAISHRRRAGRVRFQSLAGPEQFEGTQADRLTAAVAARREADPATAAMSAEAARRVLAALEEIDDELRLVVVLRDVEDMNYDEISQVTGMALGTVKSRLHRARCMLREKLADLINTP